jgi:hypothetical protein
MGSAKRVGWKQSTRFHLLKIKESRSQRPEKEELLVKCYGLWGKSMKKLLFYLLSSVSFSSVSFRRKVLPAEIGGFRVGFGVYLRA